MPKKTVPYTTNDEQTLLDVAVDLVHIGMSPQVSVEMHKELMKKVDLINMTVAGMRLTRLIESRNPKTFWTKLFHKK